MAFVHISGLLVPFEARAGRPFFLRPPSIGPIDTVGASACSVGASACSAVVAETDADD
ncbi:MAG: hypothetical protein NTW86_13415 [Candidatus Sumerlaeota bacterium]|nr:hypothetical protein [Candidatus Sumerlaeota bacterium]